MTKPAQTKAERTRQRILVAAAQEFAAHGYEATSLRRVAADADLKLGSLYFHFETKSDLLAEVLRDAVDAALERIAAGMAESTIGITAEDKLSIAIKVHLRTLHEIHERGAAVVRVVDPGTGQGEWGLAALDHVKRYMSAWTELLTEARGAGIIDSNVPPRVASRLLIGAMNATVGTRQLSPDDVNQLADAVCRMFLLSGSSVQDRARRGGIEPATNLSAAASPTGEMTWR